MTPRLPVISAAKLLKILRSRGFEGARQSGSHVVLRHIDSGWTLTVVGALLGEAGVPTVHPVVLASTGYQ